MKTVLLVCLLCPLALWAQHYKITPENLSRKQSYLFLRDGSVVRGQVLRQDSSLIPVRRRGGNLSFVEADQVVQITTQRPGLTAKKGPAGAAEPYRVFVFKDGSQVEGTFVRRDSTMITVRKRSGQLTYFEPELLSRVDSVASAAVDSSRHFTNRFSPWLLTGATAYNPERGRLYYRNTWLLLNQFDYGLTRHWSIGVSFVTPLPQRLQREPYALNSQRWTNLIRFSSRLSVPISNRIRLGATVSYQADRAFELFSTRNTLSFQPTLSIGTSQRNVTLGYGQTRPWERRYTYYSYAFSSSYPPQPGSGQLISVYLPVYQFLTVGVMQKVSPRVTFISDNTISLGQEYWVYIPSRVETSFALRLDRRRHAFDLGFLSRIYGNRFRPNDRALDLYPYVGYNLLFGRD